MRVSYCGIDIVKAMPQTVTDSGVAQVGGHIKKSLLALKDKHSIIGDVRGQGLMLGVELVKDRNTKVTCYAFLQNSTLHYCYPSLLKYASPHCL